MQRGYVILAYVSTMSFVLHFFFLQIPLRLIIFRRLNHAMTMPDRRQVVICLLALYKSLPWRLNQILGIALSFWCVVAFLATFFSNSCTELDPFLFRLCQANLAMFIVHMLISYRWIRNLLTGDRYESAMWRMGATNDVINSHSTLVHLSLRRVCESSAVTCSCTSSSNTVSSDSNHDHPKSMHNESLNDNVNHNDNNHHPIVNENSNDNVNDANNVNSNDNLSGWPHDAIKVVSGRPLTALPNRIDMCSICLSAYCEGDDVRILGCLHHYHAVCIEAWLMKKKCCPLCLRDIDMPPPERAHNAHNVTQHLKHD